MKVFSKLDFRQGYHQVRIAEGDEAKITYVMRYGSFEFLIIPFGLCNAPDTFCILMNNVFNLFLDNIMVFNENMEDHKRHLVEVFETLK